MSAVLAGTRILVRLPQLEDQNRVYVPHTLNLLALCTECQLGWDDEPEDYNVAYHRTAEEVGSPHGRGRALGKDGVQYCVTNWDNSGSPRSPGLHSSFRSQ